MVCVSSSLSPDFTGNINYQNTFLSDERDCLNCTAFGVVPGVTRTVQMTTILSVTPPRYVYPRVYALQHDFAMEIPDHCPALLLLVLYAPPPPPHDDPLLLTLRARWGSRVYQFSGNTFARMTHWEIGKHPRRAYNQDESTLYISDPPRRGALHCTGINSFLIVCAYCAEAIIHTPKERLRRRRG